MMECEGDAFQSHDRRSNNLVLYRQARERRAPQKGQRPSSYKRVRTITVQSGVVILLTKARDT
jgi:hypothetical protein